MKTPANPGPTRRPSAGMRMLQGGTQDRRIQRVPAPSPACHCGVRGLGLWVGGSGPEGVELAVDARHGLHQPRGSRLCAVRRLPGERPSSRCRSSTATPRTPSCCPRWRRTSSRTRPTRHWSRTWRVWAHRSPATPPGTPSSTTSGQTRWPCRPGSMPPAPPTPPSFADFAGQLEQNKTQLFKDLQTAGLGGSSCSAAEVDPLKPPPPEH